jgi:hypothetical protein
MKRGKKMDQIKEKWEKEYGNDIFGKWDGTMYEELHTLFKDADYVYCYAIHTPKVISYVDFSLEDVPFRFAFFMEGKKIKWVISCKEREGFYLKEFLNLEERLFRKAVEKKNALIEMIKNIPSFRVKLVMKEIEIDDGKKLNEDFIERMERQ